MSADCRGNIEDIANIVDISTECIQNILYEKFGMEKLSARWVPHLLTVELNRNRMTTLKHCLGMSKCNPNEFLRRFATVDETWLHHYTPKQWTSAGERAPKKAKTVASAGKVMATVFFGICKVSSSPTLWRIECIFDDYH